jgi:hypothetical protein
MTPPQRTATWWAEAFELPPADGAVDHDAGHSLPGRFGGEQLAGDGATPAGRVDDEHVAGSCLLQRLEDLEEVQPAGDGERGPDQPRRVGQRPDGRVEDADGGVRVADARRVERCEPSG